MTRAGAAVSAVRRPRRGGHREQREQALGLLAVAVSSGVGAATWIIFVPFALVFSVATERLGIHAGGWLLAAAAVSATGLLVAVTRQCAPQPGAQPMRAPETVDAAAAELVPAA